VRLYSSTVEINVAVKWVLDTGRGNVHSGDDYEITESFNV
jgi:hypothetical protein